MLHVGLVDILHAALPVLLGYLQVIYQSEEAIADRGRTHVFTDPAFAVFRSTTHEVVLCLSSNVTEQKWIANGHS
jgi:hypothetical protein